MSHRWSLPGVPHKGWDCVHVADLEEAVGTCEMCGKEEIRYVHTMRHPEYPDDLDVGCVCASNMESSPAAAKYREQRLRGVAGRRSRWLGRNWRISRKGNPWLKVSGYMVTVFPDNYRRFHWRYSIVRSGGVGAAPRYSAKSYPERDQAKLAAFSDLALLGCW